MEILHWIENWFLSHCDRDWESENGVELTSMSDPGWLIKIDLKETNLEGLEYSMDTISEPIPDEYYIEEDGIKITDIYTKDDSGNQIYVGLINKGFWSIKIENNQFIGMGDVKKLNFLLNKFKVLAETGDCNTILEV